MNFDPDTAGAKATERTSGLLVEEEFQIKVLTLEPGFDPDLFIRRKGKDAYAAALKNSQRYFDYLIDRARAQFPVRSAEGKQKALNHLLPHIQRVPSRIVRDDLAAEIAQKLGIDSAVLRQELKHAAASRSTSSVKAPAEAQVTDAERILIRALASATQITSEQHLSSRDGAEEEFDPARQAHFALTSEHLHLGLATESLLDTLLNTSLETADLMEAVAEADRNLFAAILMKEGEELTAERLEGAVRALRRMQLRRKLEQIQVELLSLAERGSRPHAGAAAGKGPAQAGADGPGSRRPRHRLTTRPPEPANMPQMHETKNRKPTSNLLSGGTSKSGRRQVLTSPR